MRVGIAHLLIMSSFWVLGTGAVLRAENPLSPVAPPGDNPLSPGTFAKPFAGAFQSDTITLELTFDASQNAYTGWLTVKGNRYAIGGFDDNGTLSGKFVAGGTPYPFTAKIDGQTLSLTSDGKTHNLSRAPSAAPNPLDPVGPGQPRNDGPPAPAAGAGGVGIAFEPAQDGKLMVRAIMPGGPADKAGLKPAGWLVAVDGKSIGGMGPEQIRSLLAGPIGSTVTVTIETDTEVMDVILNRADVSGARPPQPPQPEQPQPAQPGLPSGPATPGVGPNVAPAAPGAFQQDAVFLKPGLRVTYYMGSASIPGVRTVLTQDDNGNWVDPATGRRYGEAENPGSAGAGYFQLNVVAADDSGIAVDARNYILIDPQNDQTVLSTATAYLGDANGMGDFWQPPARLAAMQEQDSGGTRIRRMVYPVNSKNYNAITITTTSGANFIRNVYDTQTGLLIAASSSSVGAGTITPNPDGTSTPGAGATMITSTRIMDVREVRVPWAGSAMPGHLAQGRRFTFAGTYNNVIQGAPVMPWRLTVGFDIAKATPTWLSLKQTSALDTGMGGAPQQSTSDRVVGSNMVDPLWIDPAILAKLQPNTVIDEDRITKRRVTYQGNNGGAGVLVEQGPFERYEYAYDLRSGMLVGIQTSQQQGIATIQTQLQIQDRP